nr:TRIC cation channel family protein [Tissierella sp.]
MDAWEVFAIIGTVSFSMQGALIAMEKKYDLFAVYFLGLITAFGGGALQNVLIGGSDYQLWSQQKLFLFAIISITIIVAFPEKTLKAEVFWANILDAFGIIAFAIQGSINAINLSLPASAIVVSAIITATGGGIIRDLMVQRRPILLGENVYGLWIFMIGLIMAFRGQQAMNYRYLLFIVFSALRILSFIYDWRIPYRNY